MWEKYLQLLDYRPQKAIHKAQRKGILSNLCKYIKLE